MAREVDTGWVGDLDLVDRTDDRLSGRTNLSPPNSLSFHLTRTGN
jgi:hypothetical protein